jgi:hypothetical protein
MEVHFFSCECSDFNHIVRFDYDDDDGDLCVTVRLNSWGRWYKRLWSALKYVFGSDTAYGHWDVTILREDDYHKLHDLLDRSKLKKTQLRAAGRLPQVPTEKLEAQG